MKKILPLFLAAVFLLSSCGLIATEAEAPEDVELAEETDDYTFAEVFRGDITSTVQTTARCSYVSNEELAFKEAGIALSGLYVSVGDSVSAGDVLAELEIDDLTASRREYASELDIVKLERSTLDSAYSRTKNMINDQLDALKAAAEAAGEPVDEAAEAELEAQLAAEKSTYTSKRKILTLKIDSYQGYLDEIDAKLDARTLTAGIDGIVTRCFNPDDDYVSVADYAVITVSDPNAASFFIQANSMNGFIDGCAVTVTLDDNVYEGVIELQENGQGLVISEALREASLTSSSNTVSVSTVIGSRSDTLLLPSDAIFSLNGSPAVYRLDENGIIYMQPVTLGLSDAHYTEICSGLNEGDRVILSL